MKEAVVWVSHYTGWGFREIMEMPVIKLVEWFDSVKIFHQDRQSEQQSMITAAQNQAIQRMPNDPTRDFF